MYQVSGFRSRGFGARVTPCSNNVAGPGRQSAAQWLRAALHDAASGSVYFNTGGLDGSLQYETNFPENVGPGFNQSLGTFSDFYNNRVGVADLIALGVYYSVRACGGLPIPLRGGRVDATTAGPPGFVPQPQDGFRTFGNRFARLGYNLTEMIRVVACGHSIGGVHSPEFAYLLPPNPVNGVGFFDTTPSRFDNKIIIEYLAGNTTNPLVTGPSVALQQNSDMIVFAGDNNQTVQGLQDPATFQSICRSLLQRMIEVVPNPATLSAPVLPYALKPASLQLTLIDEGSSLLLEGWIRVRTTALHTSISSLDVTYTDRARRSCRSNSCICTLKAAGTSNGFDDSFVWFPLNITIPSNSGIASFMCTLRFVDGTTEPFDNNGAWFPIPDAVLLQSPRSCLSGNGELRVTAAVNDERSSIPVTLVVYQKVPGAGPVAVLSSNTTTMSKEGRAGPYYNFYTASYAIPGGLAQSAKFDIICNGTLADVDASYKSTVGDYFKDAGVLQTTCPPVSVPPGPDRTSTAAPSSSTEPSSSQRPSPTGTAPEKYPNVSSYRFLGCFTEADRGVRALRSRSLADDSMTLESCAAYCTAYHYFGTEYGRECYCGDVLDHSSNATGLTACDMQCSGNAHQTCGAGNRLSLYYSDNTNGPSQPPRVGNYTWHGCRTEGSSSRALEASRTSGPDMTLDRCARFCDGFAYFGAEYGRECYCGNSFAEGSAPVSFTDCSMPCVGNDKQLCGAGDRLSVYALQVARTSQV